MFHGVNEVRTPKRELQILTRTENIKEDITAGDFLLFKILIGDGADNIPSVKPRLGPKSALKYILDKSQIELKKLLKEDVNILKSFKRNKQMISMKSIPDYVKELILENIEESFANKIVPEKEDKKENREENTVEDLLSDIL